MKRKYILLIHLVLILIFMLTGCSGPLNLKDHIEINFKGSNHHAYAEWDIDEDEFLSATLLKNTSEDMDEYGTVMGSLYELEEGLNVTISPSSNLSNGDVITVTVSYPDSLEKTFNTKFSPKNGGSYKVKVEGLPEAVEIDAFEDFSLSYEGFAPNASLIHPENREINGCNVSYYCDKESDLAVGDKITVEATIDDTTNYFLKENKKEFTVENLNGYITKFADISDKTLEAMKKQSKDVWDSLISSLDSEKCQCKAFVYKGAYFLTPKAYEYSTFSEEGNQCYLIYEITMHDEKGDFKYYNYYKYTDLVQLADGNQSVDLSKGETIKGGWANITWAEHAGKEYPGYSTLESLFNQQVTAQIDEWNYESTLE